MADIVSSPPFEMFIAFSIVLNIICMGMESYKEAAWQDQFLEHNNYFFTFLFAWESLAKIFAFRPRRYFKYNWNRFDYFVVMISLFSIFAEELGNSTSVNPNIIRIIRVFRIFRILRAFRIIKAARGLHSIMVTLARSFPSILNLFGIMLLLFFVYSILGVTLFGELCVQGEEKSEGLKGVRCLFTQEEDLLNSHTTFRTVGEGILTLFRVATGDAWGIVLQKCSLKPQTGRALTDETWSRLRHFVGGIDPWLVEAKLDPDGAASDLALEVAAFAIKQWNNTVFRMEADYFWPLPKIESKTIVSASGLINTQATAALDSSPKRPTPLDWIQLARSSLHTCLTDAEARELQNRGLLDCSIDGYAKDCSHTCGDPWFGNFFFISFVCIANFVLLQLVIAVLMEQLERSRNPQSPTAHLMPGAKVLYNKVFLRMYRRWRWKANLLETTLQGKNSPSRVTQRHFNGSAVLMRRSLRPTVLPESPSALPQDADSTTGSFCTPSRRLLPRKLMPIDYSDDLSTGVQLPGERDPSGQVVPAVGNEVNGEVYANLPLPHGHSCGSMNENAANGAAPSLSARGFSARAMLRKVYGSSPASNAVTCLDFVENKDGNGGAVLKATIRNEGQIEVVDGPDYQEVCGEESCEILGEVARSEVPEKRGENGGTAHNSKTGDGDRKDVHGDEDQIDVAANSDDREVSEEELDEVLDAIDISAPEMKNSKPRS